VLATFTTAPSTSRREQVDRERTPPDLGVEPLERFLQRDAGVVHQRVEVPRRQHLEQPPHAVGGGEVDAVKRDRRQLGGERLGLGLVGQIGPVDLISVGGEPRRDRSTDPHRNSGHEHAAWPHAATLSHLAESL
jgi:hypothetical protein